MKQIDLKQLLVCLHAESYVWMIKTNSFIYSSLQHNIDHQESQNIRVIF